MDFSLMYSFKQTQDTSEYHFNSDLQVYSHRAMNSIAKRWFLIKASEYILYEKLEQLFYIVDASRTAKNSITSLQWFGQQVDSVEGCSL